MRIISLIIFLVTVSQAYCQLDSTEFYIRKLKSTESNDSLQVHYLVRLSEITLDTDPLKAVAYGEQAANIAEKRSFAPLHYKSLATISQAYRTIGMHHKELDFARKAWTKSLSLNDPNIKYDAMNLISVAYLNTGKYSEAKPYLEMALDLSEKNNNLEGKYRVYVNYANYFFRLLEPEKSLAKLRIALTKIKGQKKEEETMLINRSIGQMYALKGNVDSATNYLFPAVYYYTKKKDYKNLANAYEHLGVAYANIPLIPKMEENINNAFTNYIRGGAPILAYNSLMHSMRAYFKTMQLKKCYNVLKKTVPEFVRYNQKSSLCVAYLFQYFLHTLVYDTTTAKKYLEASKKLNEELNNPSLSSMLTFSNYTLLKVRMDIKTGDTSIASDLTELRKLVSQDQMNLIRVGFEANNSLLSKYKEDIAAMIRQSNSDSSHKNSNLFDSLRDEKVDTMLMAYYQNQIAQNEIKYRTQIKDDSLKTQQIRIALKEQSIRTRNIFLVGLGLLLICMAILFAKSKKQAAQIKKQFEQIQTLQAELKHRAGNFFNSIEGMIKIASRTTSDKETLETLGNRIGTINELYQILYSSPSQDNLFFNDLLNNICRNFESGLGSEKQIKIETKFYAKVEKNEVIPLAYIITELLTNSEKYAFEEKGGRIFIELTEMENKKILQYRDTGKGIDEDKPSRVGSQGMGIIKSYAKNLNGKISSWNDKGYNFKLAF